MRAILSIAVKLALLGLAVASALAYLGALAWPFELFAHFRPQYVAAAVALLPCALLLRQKRGALLAAALLAANAAPVWPHLATHLRLGAEASLTAADAPAPARLALRVLIYNMLGSNSDEDGFRSILASERPDLVVLTELPDDLAPYMHGLEDLYPHRQVPTRRMAHDVAIYSRWPIAGLTVDRTVADHLPVVSVDLCPPEAACLRLVALHGLVPFFAGAMLRNAQLDVAAAAARAAPDGLAVLAGDLNLTPWAPSFDRLLANGGLVDTSPLRGLTPTWATRNRYARPVARLLALSIDHVLVSPRIEARAVRVLWPLGSDHRPVIADLALPRA